MTPMPRAGLPQGTLDLLILKTLAVAPRHGWAISERLARRTAQLRYEIQFNS